MIILYRCLLLAVGALAIEPTTPTNNVKDCKDVRINNGPLITPCVSEIILEKGQNFTMICKGSTKLRFKQQEISEEVTSNFTIVNTSKSISEDEFSFQRTLDLYNVDQYAIGYYACSDDFVDENIVNTLTEEPKNNEHVSYIYVYVNGTDSLLAPMKELVMSRSNKIVIECRPSIPGVEVNLFPSDNAVNYSKRYYSPKIGFILYYDDDGYAQLKALDIFSCDSSLKDGIYSTKEIFVKRATEPPVPVLKLENKRFLEGENFSLTCTINVTLNVIADISWSLPGGLTMNDESVYEVTNKGNVTEGLVYSILNIIGATKKHEGNYSCVSHNSPCLHKESNVVSKVYLDQMFIKLRIKNRPGISRQPSSSIALELDGYPPVNNFTILKNGVKLPKNTEKYNLTFENGTNDAVFKINYLKLTDIGNYSFIANNGKIEESKVFQLFVGADPIIFTDVKEKKCELGKRIALKCDVSGYPIPKINWTFTDDNETYDIPQTSENALTLYNKTSYVDLDCRKSGSLTCTAIGSFRNRIATKSTQILVYDISEGFGILSNTKDRSQLWTLENENIVVKCLASKYDFENVTWLISDATKATVEDSEPTEFSYVSVLKIDKISMSKAGLYKCVGQKTDGSEKYDEININVLELSPPAIEDNIDSSMDVFRYMDINLNCTVYGAPRPQVQWLKDGEPFQKNISNVKIYENIIDRTTVNSTIEITKMQPENVGKYECLAVGRETTDKKAFTLKLAVETEPAKIKYYIVAIAVIFLVLIVLIVYLTIKIKKEKKFRKELAAAGLLYFKEGVINSLNPDLGIDEQAELLPYDEKFEFPPEKLVYGKQLGAGAFGVVYKAEARGIINAEETTPVAVKMVKKTADNMYIKALASELKIMVHLGKHINIVNLLGACTKNVGKRELVVIVEYCKYGNIHNYMQRHREVFIDQLDTDNKEKMGKVNRAYTASSGSTGMHSVSDYFGSSNTQNTDNTFLNTANTVRSSRKTSEGYVQPEWRSNYESDYSYDGRSPRPLSSRDLLAWSFQIARGMEYLASRKVLHGDLAARNILLADDNIVKICDFGLAKSIYKNEEYRTKENCLLPVKWLAIECMTDRIFSTQSDVWSFGIVLWEMFTLAKTPYPNILPSSLLQFLSEGHRLDKPPYADEKLYGVMKRCWEARPTMRPTFSQLQEILGTFLEDNVRNHYVDLNSGYMDKNAQASQEDYLDMVCAPDYNNMVTPSPHYVNTDNQRSFFPNSPVKVDEEGYLQMTNQGIFSPRNKDSEFDFDPRKFNSKGAEAGSCGSELTPMLTLNNLPARSGSESDHENNAPYHNVCTRIDEETDEVFVPSHNDKNAKNIQSAVTNPTYITFDHIDEKPKDINSYVNINVPNGLVK